MSKLLAVDLDGTLFYPRKLTRRIPKKNVAFLRKWIDQGNKVVLVSSRSYEFTSQLKEEIQRPVDFINFIGGQVRINDELVKDVWIEREPLKKVLKEVAENYDILSYMIATNDRLIMSNTKGIGRLFKLFYEFFFSY